MSHREFNLTVGKLPPVFDDRHVSSLRKLTEDLAGFPARLRTGHPVCQIARSNEHVGLPMMAG
jgi:hypothetical protein